MNPSASSLDRLHDIVLPPEVPWWPPAPGFWFLCVLILAPVFLFAWRSWRHWRADAYRRAALRELANASSPAMLAAVLRRTALAAFPREMVAVLTGSRWVDWLAAHSPEPVPEAVREQLAIGIYAAPAGPPELTGLADFAGRWIRHHRSHDSKQRR